MPITGLEQATTAASQLPKPIGPRVIPFKFLAAMDKADTPKKFGKFKGQVMAGNM